MTNTIARVIIRQLLVIKLVAAVEPIFIAIVTKAKI